MWHSMLQLNLQKKIVCCSGSVVLGRKLACIYLLTQCLTSKSQIDNWTLRIGNNQNRNDAHYAMSRTTYYDCIQFRVAQLFKWKLRLLVEIETTFSVSAAVNLFHSFTRGIKKKYDEKKSFSAHVLVQLFDWIFLFCSNFFFSTAKRSHQIIISSS